MSTATAEAFQHISRLDEHLHVLPDAPNNSMEPPVVAVAYSSVRDLNFADDRVYGPPNNAIQYFAKETLFMSRLNENMELGHKFLALLYSYRSVSRGIPQAQSKDQANKPELYKAAYDLLKPQVARMMDLQKYFDEACILLTTVLKSMAQEYKEGFASTEFLLTVARTLDLYMVLDMLKNAKASMNNDFSIYKRIWSNLKNLTGDVDDETMAFTVLYNFLGAQNALSTKLKDALFKDVISAASPGGKKKEVDPEKQALEDLIVDMINVCAQMFEVKSYTKPEDKHMLLKALTFGLYLLDLPGEDNDITKKKRLRLDRYGRILKANPVVPFFGDLSMTLFSFFAKTPKLSSFRWEMDASDEMLQRNYKIVHQIETLRNDYNDYVFQFKTTMNILKVTKAREGAIPESESSNLYHMLLRGITLLSDWTSRVLEQSAWKFANPTSIHTNPNCPPDAKLYELAVRYNYTVEERLALVECIGMIKTLAKLLLSVESFALEGAMKHIHNSIQSFVRTSVRDMLQHLTKKKRPVLSIVQHCFHIMADKFEIDITEDGSSNKKRDNASSSVTPRSCSVALTQLHYIRALLEYGTSDRSKGMQGGFLKEKDFKDTHVQEVNDFMNKSSFYPAMLEFGETVRQCCDLSELWYKEFYLELTKEIQFPIEMSLPWILADTVLSSDQTEMLEYVLYPFDIYNDAANRALHKLKTRFLYDELIAEVNLCFDQFVFKLSQGVYIDAKVRAASFMLDKAYKRDLEARLMVNDERFDCTQSPYGAILKQKRFQLLGRSVSIAKLVSQYCNNHLRAALEAAISRYEASDLTHIIELERLLENCVLTRRILSEHLNLDPIEDILAEGDEETSLITLNGRIVSHTIQELVNDFLPNYSYNSVTKRFIRAPIATSESEARGPPPKVSPMHLDGNKHLYNAHNAVFSMYKSFIGFPHFMAVARLLGAKHMGVILGQIFPQVEMMLRLNLTPYLKALIKGMPHSTKLPPFEYGAKGCFDYFQVIFTPILRYSELKSGVYQCFREFGNAVLFFYMMDGILRQSQTSNLVQLGSLTGDRSSFTEVPESKFFIKNVFDECDGALSAADAAVPFKKQGEQIMKLYRNHESIKLMDLFLAKLRSVLNHLRPQWEMPVPLKDELAVDHSTEFYRVWSVVQFTFIIPPAKPEDHTNREVFGDGFVWAGATIIQLLDEQRRFNAFDFVRFLTYAAVIDPKSAAITTGGVDYKRVFDVADMTNALNQEIFEYLDFRLKQMN